MPLRTVVVTGASGNLGTALLRRLAAERPDLQVRGVCRRPPAPLPPYDRVAWTALDLAAPGAGPVLREVVTGADAVVHLAWAIQPIRDSDLLSRTNVGGTASVAEACALAGVPHLVHASSIGVYAPGRGRRVAEDWPATGIRSSRYSRDKVAAERFLDAFCTSGAPTTVTRLRPTLVVQRHAASEIAQLFLGPLVRPGMVRWADRHVGVLPLPKGLQLQFVHADDVADAVLRVLETRLPGPVNLAADPLDAVQLAGLLGARPVPVPPAAARAAVRALFAARVVPTSPGWFDLALHAPLLDCTRATRELGWRPTLASAPAARELVRGLAEASAGRSPALAGSL